MNDAGEASEEATDVSVAPPSYGDASFDTFYRTSYAAVYRVVVSMTRSHAVAEELTQEALFAAHRRWTDVRTLDRPDLWVRRAAVNRAISRHRRVLAEIAAMTRLRAEPTPPDRTDDPDARLWDAVRRLPRTQAAAIALWSIDGYTLAEVGEVLGCSDETARTHLRRARERLARELEADG